MKDFEKAIERMAFAAAKDSLPTHGLFNEYQLDTMRAERMPAYREIAKVMLNALLTGEEPK